MRHIVADFIVYEHGNPEPLAYVVRAQNRCLPRRAVVEDESPEHDAHVALIVLHATTFR